MAGISPAISLSRAAQRHGEDMEKPKPRQSFFTIFVHDIFTNLFECLFTNVSEVVLRNSTSACLYHACNAD